MIKKNFNMMCSEVLEILKHCPKSDVDKIPNQLMDFLNTNKDTTHQIEINPDKSIFEQDVINETIIMIFIIFQNYWATPNEKEEIDRILNENDISFKKLHSYDIMFSQINNNLAVSKEDSVNNISQIDTEQSNKICLVEYNESLIKKIIKKLKELFKKE